MIEITDKIYILKTKMLSNCGPYIVESSCVEKYINIISLVTIIRIQFLDISTLITVIHFNNK